jgi:hypothetical protein
LNEKIETLQNQVNSPQDRIHDLDSVVKIGCVIATGELAIAKPTPTAANGRII